MQAFRLRYGLLQCILALFLLLDAPHPGLDLRPAPIAAAAGAETVVLTTAPPEASYKHETPPGLSFAKRSEEPAPTGLAPASAGESAPPAAAVARRLLLPTAPFIGRHRAVAAPPTGPPFVA